MIHLRYIIQGEYDYSASVEVFADGTVEVFSGSYVTHGADRRALTAAECTALADAVAAVDWKAALPEAGGSLTHRLALNPPGGPALAWRDALPDDRPAVQALVDLLRSL
ncbi:MAG: hypothetical protein AAF624_08885 [Bacteroidota bacterium]